METTNDENVIFFKDIIFSALHRWRAGILLGLILACLLGGYAAVSSWNDISVPTDPQVYATQLEQYEANRSILTQTVANHEQRIEYQQEYMTNSVLMGLDPYDHYRVRFSVYVDINSPASSTATSGTDKTLYILNAYRAKFSSTETMQVLAETVDTETLYMSEIYAVEIPQSSAQITVTILQPTKESAELLLTQLNAQFELFREDLSKNILDHNAQILEHSIGRVSDPTLFQKQLDAQNYLQELMDAHIQAQADLSALTPPSATNGSRSSFVKKTIFLAALGAIAGYGIVAVFGWIEMVAGQKVYSSRALRSRTGVKVLGCCSPNKKYAAIDRFIYQLEGRDISPSKDRAAVLAKDVAHRCDGVTSLLVTGDMDKNNRAFLLEALQQAMPRVQILDNGSILRCADAVDALKRCDKVLLVEQCSHSHYNNIATQCQKAADYEKYVLGCILLGG